MVSTTKDVVITQDTPLKEPIYVFEAPVRLWHWTHTLSIIALIVTGYLVANPLPSISGEASDHFMFGTIRLIHFGSAYVFAIGFAVRIYWALVGNKWSRELFIVPFWRGAWWAGLWHEIRFYTFTTRTMGKHIGHNPLAQAAMWVLNVLLGLFMIATGFALYSQGAGAGSWADTWFGWVFVLVPSSQTVRMWHLMGMWLMLLFVIIHVYMAIRAEMMSRQNSVGVILSGWRTWKDDGPMKPQ